MILQGAASDCETIRAVVGQPMNVASSLAMSVFGLGLVVVARRWEDRLRRQSLMLLGGALTSTGIGSALFHGPGGTWAWIAHDVTITAIPLAAALGFEAERRQRPAVVLFLAAMAAAVLARWASVEAQTISVALAFVGLLFAAYRRRSLGLFNVPWLVASAGLLVAARVIFSLSRTGSVLCQPDSLLQGHAAWHVLIALAVVAAAKGFLMLPEGSAGAPPQPPISTDSTIRSDRHRE